MKLKRIVSSLCIMFVISLVASLTLAAKKAPKVYPDLKRDKALAYLCFTYSATTMINSTIVCLDDTPLGGAASKKQCTYDYIEPGSHFLWNGQSGLVEPLMASVIEMNFEAGQTYYFDASLTEALTWKPGVTLSLRLLDGESGKQRVETAKSFNATPIPREERHCEKKFAKFGLNGANNPFIAAARISGAVAKTKSAEASDGKAAADKYRTAAALFADAADNFTELAAVTKKRKTNAIVGNMLSPLVAQASADLQAKMSIIGIGVALYTITETSGLKELIVAYEEAALEARNGETECLRRIACLDTSKDDTAVAKCIGKTNAEE